MKRLVLKCDKSISRWHISRFGKKATIKGDLLSFVRIKSLPLTMQTRRLTFFAVFQTIQIWRLSSFGTKVFKWWTESAKDILQQHYSVLSNGSKCWRHLATALVSSFKWLNVFLNLLFTKIYQNCPLVKPQFLLRDLDSLRRLKTPTQTLSYDLVEMFNWTICSCHSALNKKSWHLPPSSEYISHSPTLFVPQNA